MGLLDSLNSEDARFGLGLLAAGGYQAQPMNFGQRIQQAMGGMEAYKQNEMKSRYMQSQLDENTSQIEQRKQQLELARQKQAYSAAFLGDGPQGSAIPEGAAGSPQAAQAFAQGTPATFGGVALTARQISQKFGIPMEAIVSDYNSNGGKKIAEFIMKQGTPDMQVANGYAYDKNKQGAGFMPSLTTSTSGQTSMNRIGPDGLPVVSAPAGALETYGAYKAADAGLKPIKVFNPATQREEFSTEGAVAGAARPGYATEPQMRATVGGSMGADPAAIQREIKATQTSLMQPMDEGSKAQLRAHLVELQSNPAGRAPGNFAAGPSAAEAATAKAGEITAEQRAKDVAEQRKSIMNAGFSAPSTIAKYQQLGKLLEGVDGGSLTATGTNLASAMNSLGFKIDKNLPNKEAAAALGNQMALELRNPANGAGMPGAMSDADRNYLVSMIPNASQSLQGRKQLIEAQIAISQRQAQVATFARNYEKKHGALDNGFFEQMQAWSSANPLFRGK